MGILFFNHLTSTAARALSIKTRPATPLLVNYFHFFPRLHSFTLRTFPERYELEAESTLSAPWICRTIHAERFSRLSKPLSRTILPAPHRTPDANSH